MNDGLSSDEIGLALLENILSSTTTRFNEAQVRDFESLTRYRIPKINEQLRINYIREYDKQTRKPTRITFYVLGDIMTDKPFIKERNGEVHILSTQDCILRRCTYYVAIYCSMRIIQFSVNDPSLEEEKKKLISIQEQGSRVVPKGQNVRVNQLESSVIPSMRRLKQLMEKTKPTNNTMTNSTTPLESIDEEEEVGDSEDEDDNSDKSEDENEKEQSEEDENDENSSIKEDNPYVLSLETSKEYQNKLQECREICCMTSREIETYPYFISQQIHNKHTLFHLPIMPNTKLCHNYDEMEKNNDPMYVSGGTFLVSGLEHPFMGNMSLAYNEIYMLHKDYVECRSGHSWKKSRASSSTLQLWKLFDKKKPEATYMGWCIPYRKEVTIPFMVFFQAMGLFDVEKIKLMIRFQIDSHYNHEFNQRRIPWEVIEACFEHTFSFHSHGSENIKTEEDAWFFIGELLQTREINELAVQQEIETSEVDVTLGNTTNLTAYDVPPEINPETGKVVFKTLNFKIPDDWRRRILTRSGRNSLCNEILPHLGYDSTSWPSKIWYLGEMTKVLMMNYSAPLTDDPQTFFVRNGRDLLAYKRLHHCGAKIGSGLLKTALTGHVNDMARKKFRKALLDGRPLHPSDALDHIRITRMIFRSIASGIWKAGPNPAANMFGGSGNQLMNHIRAGPGGNINNGGGVGNPLTTNPIKARTGSNAKASKDQTGITQPQNNVNVAALMSQQRRINKADSYGAGGGSSGARDIHDDWQVICPFDTPDSRSCGLVKSHSLFSRDSHPTMTENLLIEFVQSQKLVTTTVSWELVDNFSMMQKDNRFEYIAVVVNCHCLGYVSRNDAIVLSSVLREHRYYLAGDSYMSVTISTVESKLLVYTDQSRLVAGYLVAKNFPILFGPTSKRNKTPLWKSLTEEQLMENNFLVFLDKMELTENVTIAKSIEDVQLIEKALEQQRLGGKERLANVPFDYCEISLLTLLSMPTSLIPFQTHNQAPRNNYQSQMERQVKQNKFPNSNRRLERVHHCLLYPTHPLIKTPTTDLFCLQDVSTGSQVTVAIVCDRNENIEDAIIFNQGAAERGFGRTMYSSTTTIVQKHLSHAMGREWFTKPDANHTLELKDLNRNHLRDSDGLPLPGSILTTQDCMVGKVIRWNKPKIIKTRNGQEIVLMYSDTSVETTSKQVGFVHSVVINNDSQNQRKVNIRIDRLCKLTRGNKVTSRHAQKNTCVPRPEVNSPYTQDGICPMLTINPHAFPGRMSIAQMIEQLAGWSAIAYGSVLNGTPFSQSAQTELQRLMQQDGHKYFNVFDEFKCAEGDRIPEDFESQEDLIDFLVKALEKRGIMHQGKQVLYSGYTGRRLKNSVFLGPLFEGIMIHMAADKLSYRAEGKLHQATRQGVESSAYKLAEMEKNACISSGVSGLLWERHSKLADPHTVFVCHICGTLSHANIRDQVYYCRLCDSTSSVVKIQTTFGFKSLQQVLTSAMVMPRLYTSSM